MCLFFKCVLCESKNLAGTVISGSTHGVLNMHALTIICPYHPTCSGSSMRLPPVLYCGSPCGSQQLSPTPPSPSPPRKGKATLSAPTPIWRVVAPPPRNTTPQLVLQTPVIQARAAAGVRAVQVRCCTQGRMGRVLCRVAGRVLQARLLAGCFLCKHMNWRLLLAGLLV